MQAAPLKVGRPTDLPNDRLTHGWHADRKNDRIDLPNNRSADAVDQRPLIYRLAVRQMLLGSPDD